ncbi:hypothetical protein E3N88_36681 [Mikania micrantha]|uniref:SGNH hydrolase-type esterase domain-containing protein n=1 Tax=Mikania micrantha TaxID=192012 RepID=A0A5N6M4Y5_9ASTR|nr:hypothetical protein E3N88_36681 [Mikania micrantha]
MFPPYGETFFHKPTGRCSNGRLIIDFIAESLGMPLIPPSEGVRETSVMEHGQGVNFAVAGATALDSSFHEAHGVVNQYTNVSLGVQLEWFKNWLPYICGAESDCKNILRSSLILMGEIGGNDYNHAVIAGKSIDDLKSYVPLVINTIISGINELIELGAETLVVPGNLPIGCSAAYLTIYYGSDEVEYDKETGCLIELNKFAEWHNELLQKALNQIRDIHPHVNIIYADYYNAAMQFFRSPQKYGFTNGALTACCGGGGPYNYNQQVECADPSSTTCSQPETYANWDGLHLTEAAYHVIFKNLLLQSNQRTTKSFSFGDSIADTRKLPPFWALANPVIGKLPYGETFFHHATGRCSDGRLIIDFIAEEYGLPYLPPYLAIVESLKSKGKHGVNFAVAGATALDAKYFYDQGIGRILWTNDSLNTQLGWFKRFKSSMCTTKQECDKYFARSLFVMGEIGGNDYNYAFSLGGTIMDLKRMVPLVVGTIISTTSTLIEEGAKEVMVPGNFPIGCSAVYLTLFGSNKTTSDYDENGCLKAYNAFSKYHNTHLKLALQKLSQKYSQARIIYADYYGAAKSLFHTPRHLRLENGALRACCGGGGPYNFNYTARCGHIGSKACKDPWTYANWDGVHLTETAYRHISTGLLKGTFTSPPI